MAFIIADRVKETSTTTGTGALTLAGAATAFRAFSAVMAVGDTCYYAIQAIDGVTPSGAWEVGLGTYSGASTLTRTTVLASSNAGAAVSFAAGTKEVYITLPAVQASWMREKLTAARTYYVRTDGSDSNTGLVDSAGGAFLTLAKAASVIATLDLGGQAVTVQVRDGTYTAGVSLPDYVGGGSVTFLGNTGTPANVVISTTSSNCFSAAVAKAYTINGFKLQTTTSGVGIDGNGRSTITFSNINFGACATAHINARGGAVVQAGSNYAISGASAFHLLTQQTSFVDINGRTLTITGTPAFTTFAFGTNGGILRADGCTFSGSATGQRYNFQYSATCNVNGAASTYLPGDTAGATSVNGFYG